MFAGINTHRKHENVVWTNVASSIINNKKSYRSCENENKTQTNQGGDVLSDSPIPRAQSPRQSRPSQRSLTWLFVCFHTTASQNTMPTCLEKIISHTYGACL